MKGHWPARPILSFDDSMHRTHIEVLTMISPFTPTYGQLEPILLSCRR